MNESRRKVKIVMTSLSRNEGKDVILTDGFYAGRGNLHVLQYGEQGEGMEGTSTRLSFLNGHASMVRQGSVNSKMDFYPTDVKRSYYETPYGAIFMEIETMHVSFAPVPDGFEGRIVYRLLFGGDHGTCDERDLRIRVTFCE